MFTVNSFYDWLLSRVRDGGSAALAELSKFAITEKDIEMKGPVVSAMLCWGVQGCEAILRVAQRGDSTGSVSSACRALSAAAAGCNVPDGFNFVRDAELLHAINAAITGGNLRLLARESLMDLMQSVESSTLLISLGVTFTTFGITGQGGLPELVRAISNRWLRLGPGVTKKYASLIQSHPDDEPLFQDFFCKHPQLLDPMALQVWSQPDFHGKYEPDFVIRRSDNTYIIIEIETPAKQLMTQSPQLSAYATHAEQQAAGYRDFLDERMLEAQRYFPHYRGAEWLAVVGLESKLNEGQAKEFAGSNKRRHGGRIVGFDWIKQRADALIENVTSAEIEVSTGLRVV